MNTSKKPSTESKKSKPTKQAKSEETSGKSQLSDEALDKVTGGATIPNKRKKPPVVWA